MNNRTGGPNAIGPCQHWNVSGHYDGMWTTAGTCLYNCGLTLQGVALSGTVLVAAVCIGIIGVLFRSCAKKDVKTGTQPVQLGDWEKPKTKVEWLAILRDTVTLIHSCGLFVIMMLRIWGRPMLVIDKVYIAFFVLSALYFVILTSRRLHGVAEHSVPFRYGAGSRGFVVSSIRFFCVHWSRVAAAQVAALCYT